VIVCRTCGHQNPDGAEFCASCRTYLAWDGDKVQASAPPAASYAGQPAAPAGSAPVASPPATTGAGPVGNGHAAPDFPPGPSAYPPGPTGTEPGVQAVQPGPERPLPPAEPEPTRVERRPGVKYCTVCGADNEAERRFCRSCGNDLLLVEPVRVSWWRRLFGRKPPATAAGERPGQRRHKREHRNRKVIRGSIATVLAVAIALLAFPFRSNVVDAYHNVKGKITKQYQPVKATSANASSTAKGHPASNVIDGVKNSSWAEGVRGDGVNESVTVHFGRKVDVARIGITPGASDVQKVFLAQPRPKQIRIEFSNGRQTVITLTDSASFQQFDVTGNGVEFVRLVMIAMFPGQSGHNASIAEVEFFSKG
jgi:ribosomal protein L40E